MLRQAPLLAHLVAQAATVFHGQIAPAAAKDSDSLPEYPILDDILFRYIELNQSFEEILEAGHDIATVEKTVRLVNMNEYKRFQTPPILRVSSKAFGIGRRIPLVAKLG